MKRRAYCSAGSLGASGAVLLGCLILYVWGAFPVRRHPYAYPFSLVCGSTAAILCAASFGLWFYYIIKLPHGARVRAILCSVLLTAAAFFAGSVVFAYGYELISVIVHRLDP